MDHLDVISFYLNESTDALGRSIEDMWAMTDEELMHSHDVIQVLFPTTEESAFNPDAPLLTETDIRLFQKNPELQERLLASFHRFLRVFGLNYADDVVSGNTDTWVFAKLNHNWLRFTRIMRCLTTLGRIKEAQAFLAFLETHVGNPGDSWQIWHDAVHRPAGPSGRGGSG